MASRFVLPVRLLLSKQHGRSSPHPRRIARLLTYGAALALPMSVVAATGSSSAAPTLTVAQAQARLADLQTRADAAVEAFDAGRLASHAAQRRMAVARAQVSAEQTKLVSVQHKAAVFAVSAYTTAGAGSLTGLLDGQNPATVLDRAGALDQIARSRAAQLTALSAERTRLAGVQKQAADRAADLAARERALAREQAKIKALVAQQQQVLDRLQAQQRAQLLAERAQQRAAAAQAAVRIPLSYRSAAGGASGTPPAAAGIAAAVLQAAYAQRGKPYVYGAAGPGAFDCSGLVMWAFAHAGVSLPHSAAAQYGYGTHVSRAQLQPGDIVFYDEGGTIGHDGIYVGGGMMIDANHTGGWVDVRPLYNGFVGGTRL